MTKYNAAQPSFLCCCQPTHFLLSYFFLFNNVYHLFYQDVSGKTEYLSKRISVI